MFTVHDIPVEPVVFEPLSSLGLDQQYPIICPWMLYGLSLFLVAAHTLQLRG